MPCGKTEEFEPRLTATQCKFLKPFYNSSPCRRQNGPPDVDKGLAGLIWDRVTCKHSAWCCMNESEKHLKIKGLDFNVDSLQKNALMLPP